eukprot:m51a1_g12867 hypothetical protein (308) ;mRNA; r:1838-2847
MRVSIKAGTGQLVVVALVSWVCGVTRRATAAARPGRYPVVDLGPLAKTYTGIRGVDAVVVLSQPGEVNARRTRMRALMAAHGIRNAQWRETFTGAEWMERWRARDFAWDAAYSRLDAARQAAINEGSAEPPWRMWRWTSQWQSVVVAWRVFLASNMSVALFLEDDVDLSRTFVRDVERALAVVPADWETLRLGNCEPRRARVLAGAPNVWESISMSCLDSYLLNARNVGRILDCLDLPSHPVSNPDLILNNCLDEKDHHGMRSYSVIPRIAGQMHLVRRFTGNWTHKYFQQLFNHIPQEYGEIPALH